MMGGGKCVILALRFGAGVRACPAVFAAADAAGAAAAAALGIGVAVHAEDGGLNPFCLDAADSVESALQRHVMRVSRPSE
jgi:hypothetical protein